MTGCYPGGSHHRPGFPFQLQGSGLLATPLLTVDSVFKAVVTAVEFLSWRTFQVRGQPPLFGIMWVQSCLGVQSTASRNSFQSDDSLILYQQMCRVKKVSQHTEWLWRTFLFMGQRKNRSCCKGGKDSSEQDFLIWFLSFLKSWQSCSGQQSDIYGRAGGALPTTLQVALRAVAFTHLQGQDCPQKDCGGAECLFKVTDPQRNSSTSPQTPGQS